MRIPNLTHMLVNVKVHESMISRVRGDEFEKTGYGEFRQVGLLTGPDLFSRMIGPTACSGPGTPTRNCG
jgi:hypothetical protein